MFHLHLAKIVSQMLNEPAFGSPDRLWDSKMAQRQPPVAFPTIRCLYPLLQSLQTSQPSESDCGDNYCLY